MQSNFLPIYLPIYPSKYMLINLGLQTHLPSPRFLPSSFARALGAFGRERLPCLIWWFEPYWARFIPPCMLRNAPPQHCNDLLNYMIQVYTGVIRP